MLISGEYVLLANIDKLVERLWKKEIEKTVGGDKVDYTNERTN